MLKGSSISQNDLQWLESLFTSVAALLNMLPSVDHVVYTELVGSRASISKKKKSLKATWEMCPIFQATVWMNMLTSSAHAQRIP